MNIILVASLSLLTSAHNFNCETEIYHRFNFRKNVLDKKLSIFDPTKTEWENMKDNMFDRIWDCGNVVFIKNYG